MKNRKYVCVDSRNRSLAEIPRKDAWLFAPENKESLDQVLRGLKQKPTIDRGSFSKYVDNEE